MTLSIDLTGKIALVLGGSRGIGAGITEALCQGGASTVFTHTGRASCKGSVASLLKHLKECGSNVQSVICDALDSERTAQVVQQLVAEHGGLDILVANVGQNAARAAQTVTDEEWTHTVDVNLSSAFYGIRAALKPMLQAQRGRIILIGSSAVYDGGGGAIDYAAAKAGLEGMKAYLCRNYARRGILTNVIHPCVIETDLLRERYGDEDKKMKLIAQIPVGRLGRPMDIAAMVAYLASPLGEFVCGQSILIDGGRTFFR